MNFYPFHPGDYMLRTGHLSVIEDLAYRRLLDLYYINELPLQGTPDAIARVIRMRDHAGDVAVVLGEFFELTDEGYRHYHCDGVITQYQAKAKQAVENGKRGGRPRKAESNHSVTAENPEKTQPVISAIPEETGSKANQEPITNNQEPEEHPQTPKGAEAVATVDLDLESEEPTDDLFNRFWDKYPRKTDKTKAKAKWAKLKVTQALFDQIMRGLAAHCASADWLKDSGQFIPHPTTWLNGRRWEDELRPANVHQLRSRHHGFEDRDYTQGLTDRGDGTYDF